MYDLAAERRSVARATERWLRWVLPRQRLDGSDQDGGFDEDGDGWCDGREAAFNVARLSAALAWIGHGDVDADPQRLREAIRRAMRFVVRRQRDDGWLDLAGQYSPNEAGFPVPGLVESYKRLKPIEPELFERVREDIERFILRAAEAVLAGSAYTANHRWAAAAAPLAAVHSLFPDPRYLQKIDAYLADGIDCDDSGLWHVERSPNYNIVANAGLLVIADCLDRPALLAPVERNLRFTLASIQPNGEADSSFSHRQDRAQPDRAPAVLGQARRIAQVTGDGRFTALAESCWPSEQSPFVHESPPLLFQIDNHPAPLPPAKPLPTDYEFHDVRESLVRVRRGNTALTLTADAGGHFFTNVRDRWGGSRLSDDWVHLHHDDIVLQSVHLEPAGMYAIQPATLQCIAKGRYHLAGQTDGWTHTLHFRPGSPDVHMPWDLRFEIESRWDESGELLLRIKADTSQSLVANLTFWVRGGVRWCEQTSGIAKDEGAPVIVGSRTMLAGGARLGFQSERTQSRIEISGLPRAGHRCPVQSPQPIPSGMRDHCGAFSLGLGFPVDLELRFLFG